MLKIGIIGHKEVPSYNGGIEAVLTETIPLFDKDDVELTIYNRWTTFYNLKEWREPHGSALRAEAVFAGCGCTFLGERAAEKIHKF